MRTRGITFDEGFLARYKRSGKSGTAILFFHSFDENDVLEWQGYIWLLRADGTGTAQLFEWVLGEPGDEVKFTAAFLPRCVFYATDREMKQAYDAYSRERERADRAAARPRVLAPA